MSYPPAYLPPGWNGVISSKRVGYTIDNLFSCLFSFVYLLSIRFGFKALYLCLEL